MKKFFRNSLKNKKFRHSYAQEIVGKNIAHQIRKLREDKGWTQKKWEQETGRKQSVISRVESPSYGKLTLRTLFDIAEDYDVAVQIRFVSFSDFFRQNHDLGWQALTATRYENDNIERTFSDLESGSRNAPAVPKDQNLGDIIESPNDDLEEEGDSRNDPSAGTDFDAREPAALKLPDDPPKTWRTGYRA